MDITSLLEAFGAAPALAFQVATAIIALASVLNAVVPRVPDSSPWSGARALLNTLAIGHGHAAPAAPDDASAGPKSSAGAGPISTMLGVVALLLLAGCHPGTTGSINIAALQSALVPGLICATDLAGKVQAVATTSDSNGQKAIQAAVAAGAGLAGDAACVAALKAVAAPAPG